MRATHRFTYRVDGNASCKVEVLFAIGIPHPDTLRMGEHDVRPYISLQDISAEGRGFELKSQDEPFGTQCMIRRWQQPLTSFLVQ